MNVRRRTLLVLVVGTFVVACNDDAGTRSITSTTDASLDAQVRQSIGNWGVVPILPVKGQDPALVDLGRMLFFDKLLSGNRDVSCASCHSPLTNTGDDRSLAVGTGAIGSGSSRQLGTARDFTPRNAPSLFNAGLGGFYMFWDGRIAGFGSGFQAPLGLALPSNLSGLVAAQAMIPVTNRVEMRGNAGDRDVFGNLNELAQIPDSQNTTIWNAVMTRVMAVAEYKQRFNAAFPGLPATAVGFQHAANAIAAFEAQAFSKTNSPFDRFLARDGSAMSADAKRGALLFFGRAGCSSCHNGPLLGGQEFANVGVPQLGPGTGRAAPLDGGRDDFVVQGKPQFMFRVAPLRNVELTAPYMHDGAYATLEAVVGHYNNVDSAMKAFSATELDPAYRSSYRGDAATIAQVLSTVDGRLRVPLHLSPDEQRQIVAFLKSLTDPAARDLSSIIPASVPSGLPVRDP